MSKKRIHKKSNRKNISYQARSVSTKILLVVGGLLWAFVVSIFPQGKMESVLGAKDFGFRLLISSYPLIEKNPPDISTASYLVADIDSGAVLFSYDADKRLSPASLTKLMTALVALDYFRSSDVILINNLKIDPEESDIGLKNGQKITVGNLLMGLLISSGNDTAYVLAESIPGGQERFVYMMNQKARFLNMTNTHFTNPSGKDEDGHYSTARDLFILSKEVLNHTQLKKITGTATAAFKDEDNHYYFSLKSLNQLLGTIYGVDGLKTGYTENAGQCLILTATRDGHRIITVVLGSQDRFTDSSRLLEWAFQATWEPAPVL